MLSSPRALRNVAFGCSLHASVDFREKLYKVLASVAKLAGEGGSIRAAKIAQTLSTSRGIFKILKWVNCIDTYQKSLVDSDPLLAALSKVEAVLNTIVTVMQDLITLDKLCLTEALSKSFAWWMNFLDLLLSILLAGIASYSLNKLLASGVDSPKAAQKLLLLRLELGVRVADSIALLQDTSVYPGGSIKRPLWRGPGQIGGVLASLASAACATSAVGVKRWAALPAPAPAAPRPAARITSEEEKAKRR